MDFNLIGAGSNTSVETQVDPTFQAIRSSIRPIEYIYGSLIGGHYSIGSMTGLIAAGIASGAQVFQVRWADPAGKLFILKKLVIQCSTATGFAATSQGAPLELILGHNSTASGSGGTALVPNSTSNRMRQTMNTSSFASAGEIRIATTAALGAATGQVLEPNPIASCMGADNRTLVSTSQMILFDIETADHPGILNSGDTLAIRTNTPAGTGTWYMSVLMSWLEAVNY